MSLKPQIQKIISFLHIFFNWKRATVAGWAVVVFITSLFAGDLMLYLSEDSEEMEQVSAVIRNYFLVVAGVVAFVITVIRVRQTDKQISQANDQIQIAKSEADGRENERVRESFQEAVAMLFGDEEDTKPFAITQIGRIGLAKPDQHLEQAIDLLCIFARKNFPNGLVLDPYNQIDGGEKENIEGAKQCIKMVFELAAEFEAQGRGEAPIDLRNTVIGERTIKGVTLTEMAISGCVFNRTVFSNCTFTGKFTTGHDDRVDMADDDYAQWSFNGVTFTDTTFCNAEFHGVGFSGAKFIECTADSSTWQGVDFEAATFSKLKIKDEYSKVLKSPLSSPLKNTLFGNCHFGGVEFEFFSQEEQQKQSTLGQTRLYYLTIDFASCYVCSGKKKPSGLENNQPPMDLKHDGTEENGLIRFWVVEASADTHTP